jgi:fimbrial chaperone protein
MAIGPAFAGSIAVNPIRLTLSASQSTGALTVSNNGVEPSVVQVQVVSWSQQDGKEVNVPTKELLATPPIFTVPAGGSQIVRIGLRKSIDSQREVTYRVILQEVPPPPKPEFRGLQVALRLSVPIFVAPPVASAPSVQWRATRILREELNIAVANTGNAHVQITGFKLSVAGAQLSPVRPPDAAYVLPDQHHDWTLRVNSVPDAGAVLHVIAQSDAGELQADVVVAGP